MHDIFEINQAISSLSFLQQLLFILPLSLSFVLINIIEVNTPDKYNAGSGWKGEGEGGERAGERKGDEMIAKVDKWKKL